MKREIPSVQAKNRSGSSRSTGTGLGLERVSFRVAVRILDRREQLSYRTPRARFDAEGSREAPDWLRPAQPVISGLRSTAGRLSGRGGVRLATVRRPLSV